jgi:hypothetical protein
MNATIAKNEIAVTHSYRPEVDREFLIVNVPNGWDDVKKLTNKILQYDGRKFVYSGWNSDTLQCYFYRKLDGSTLTAKICKV